MKPRVRLGVFLAAALIVAGALAFFASPHASTAPDGLNRVAADHGFASAQQDHALQHLPTAGYEVRGIDNRSLSKGLAGLIGVTVTGGLTGGTVLLLRRTSRGRDQVT